MTTKGPDDPGSWRYALTVANAAPRCGARRKVNGLSCRAPAMPNGRCHKHGGASTGPRTAEGKERCRQAPWRHGGRSAEPRKAAAKRGAARRLITSMRALIRE
jgi:hypothetical protein